MLDDFLLNTAPTNFYPNNPVKIHEFSIAQDGELTPVINIPQQPTGQQQAFHLEILVPKDFSFLTVHEVIDVLHAAYNYAELEWNITMSQMIEKDSVVVCVVGVGEAFNGENGSKI